MSEKEKRQIKSAMQVMNPEMVKLARDIRQLTQNELAEKLGVNQAKVSRIENGLVNELPDEELKQLADTLKFPVEFFFQTERLTGAGTSAYYHRKRQKLSAGDWNWIHGVVNVIRIGIKRMLSGDVHSRITLVLPQLDLDDVGTPDEAARVVRDAWLLPPGPVQNLIERIEDAGVFVVPCQFNTRYLDATSIALADSPAIIFYNEGLTGDRLRFTLAHELGHLVMHQVPTATQEKEADQFAAEFLMPARDIRPDFRRKLSLKVFAALKPKWQTAMSALVRRAYDLGAISESQYKYYNIALRRMGYPEPVKIPAEKPRALRELIDFYLSELKYSADELAALLHLKKPDLKQFYDLRVNIDSPRLSVVR